MEPLLEEPILEEPILEHIDLIYNKDRDTSSVENIMLIYSSVSGFQHFYDSANSVTFPIIYSYSSDPNELLQLLQSKFTHITRVSFVFHDPVGKSKVFMDSKPFFTNDDIILGQTNFSDNVIFMKKLITDFSISNIDFLSCNSLNYENWILFYNLLTSETNVIVGASDNLSGNVKYGADWVMENTNIDIKNIYFNDNIVNYSGYLSVTTIDNIVYTLNTDNTATVMGSVTDISGALIIPDFIRDGLTDYKVEIIGFQSFASSNSLTSVQLGNNVTTIEAQAFMRCGVLSFVHFNTNLTNIKDYAFYNCFELVDVNLSECLLTNIGIVTFYGCSKLETATIPDSVTYIGPSTFHSTSLQTINIPSNVTIIQDNLFYNCTKLTSVILHNTVTDIKNGVFFNCLELTSIRYDNDGGPGKINLPDSVTAIGQYSFYDCINILSINIPDNVTTIEKYTFHGCKKLSDIKFNVSETQKLTTINEYAFVGCSNLTECTIPTVVETIRRDAFFNSGLTSFIIPDSVTWIEQRLFCFCKQMTSVTIGAGVTSLPSTIFGDCILLNEITFSNISSIKSIYNAAFIGCASLPEFTIPESVTYLGAQMFESCSNLTSVNFECVLTSILTRMFYNCTSLMSFDLPNTVIIIEGRAFNYCNSLSSFNIPADSKLITIETSAFENCTSLLSFDTPNDVTTIGSAVFNNCSSMTSVSLNNGITDIMPYMFNGCLELLSCKINGNVGQTGFFDLPNSVTYIGDGAFKNCVKINLFHVSENTTTIGNDVFNGCAAMTSITVPNSVTSMGYGVFQGCVNLQAFSVPPNLTTIERQSFWTCTKLDTINIPSGKLTTIGDKAFCQCDGLTSVNIADSVTNVGGDAFYQCTNLVSVKLPSNLKIIGPNAFRFCSSLESIVIPKETEVIGNDAFGGCNNLISVYVIQASNISNVAANSFTNVRSNQNSSIIKFGDSSVTGVWEIILNFYDDVLYDVQRPSITNFNIREAEIKDEPFNIVTPISGLPGSFSYTSSDQTIATIDGNKITLTGISGETIITAIQDTELGIITAEKTLKVIEFIIRPTTIENPLPVTNKQSFKTYIESSETFADLKTNIVLDERFIRLVDNITSGKLITGKNTFITYKDLN